MDEYIIKKDSLEQLANIIRDKYKLIDPEISLVSKRKQFNIASLPEDITSIGFYAFGLCSNLALTSLPEGITSIHQYAFRDCTNLKSLTFKGTPTTINSTAFNGCNNLTTINVPWSEGEVANAPWGATNATINYNYREAV